MEISFSHKLLQSFFSEEIPKPKIIADLIMRHSFEVVEVTEKQDDANITVDILPNRAHDALGYYFFAKELSVLCDKKLNPIKEYSLTEDSSVEPTEIIIKDGKLCNRYCSQRIENIKVGESPNWLKDALKRIGQKSINNIVDATNYILWVYNQPTHVFDADKVGNKIFIRNANDNEKITTLDNKDVALNSQNLIIASENSPLAIAGVKGGKYAEVGDKTTSIILESANFNPVSVRKTSREHGIITDSSRRFEHHISPELAYIAIEQLSQLIVEISGTKNTKVSKISDAYPVVQKPSFIQVSIDTINKILGVNATKNEISNILTKLKFDFEELKLEGIFSVLVPYERLDLKKTEDLVEEVGRIYGYDNIKPAPIPDMDFSSIILESYLKAGLIENVFIKRGFSQIGTYPLQGKGEVEILNPLSKEKKALRKSMLPKFKDALKLNAYNMDLLGITQVKIFEIGKVFQKDGSEKTNLTIGIKNGKLYKDKKREEEYLRSIIDDINNENDINIKIEDGNIEKNEFGIIFEIETDKIKNKKSTDYEHLNGFESAKNKYKNFSPYPFIVRDIAVLIPNKYSNEDLLSLIKKIAGDLLVTTTYFDKYEKEDKTSHAYRMVFQSHDRTLTDEEVNNIMLKIKEEIEKNEGWQVR